ncbi:MAG: hypothetical protein KC994_08870 [Candidatus Omnitrophica bacterium]|nr:hypothetical protein [Candidatus Omnitrophota bacterium]
MSHRILSFNLIAILFVHSTSFGSAYDEAKENAAMAREALIRSRHTLHAYLDRRDPVTGLLPRSGQHPAWYVRDSAADLYPFLVLAARFVEPSVYENEMHEILRREIQQSTRFCWLSDNVAAGGGFEDPEIDLDRLIFGSSEYAKDGLLPLSERLGRTAWLDRMVHITDDILSHAPYETRFGKIPSLGSEVNGEMLQVLTRLAYLTHDPRYIDQAITITRFYFEEVIPKSNGLPPQTWNLAEEKPELGYFNLADHGNEIVGGLSEFVLFLKEENQPLYPAMAKSLSELVNLILDVGRNKDGVWVLRVACEDYEITDTRHAHCWGYLFNGVYTAYLVTGEERFRDALKFALKSVKEKPTYLDDPQGSGRGYGSNAYSDAIESAIVFLNRFPDEELFEVLDRCVDRFLKRQREDGIIEDWYGDGNYVRTALMYAFMKSQGVWIEPWREDVQLGAAMEGDSLVLALNSENPWEGKVRFDIPRHREFFNMPINYPRLNEFPEWFTVNGDSLYQIEVDGNHEVRCGGELIEGFDLKSDGKDWTELRVETIPGPPYSKP